MTTERQLTFLDTLARTRSVTAAARAAGMSRESAHRLRARDEGGLLAALWGLALAPSGVGEGHNASFADGRLARVLGRHLRRRTANLVETILSPAGAPERDPARPS